MPRNTAIAIVATAFFWLWASHADAGMRYCVKPGGERYIVVQNSNDKVVRTLAWNGLSALNLPPGYRVARSDGYKAGMTLLPNNTGNPCFSIQLDWMIGADKLVVDADDWFAGAISSIWFRGVQYLDNSVHGRSMGAAVTFDRYGECFNPTLDGSGRDDGHYRTTSKLLSWKTTPDSLSTTTQMAYWFPARSPHQIKPGDITPCTREHPEQRTAVNSTDLSDVIFSWTQTFGYRGVANAVSVEGTYSIGSPHQRADFEMLATYLPLGTFSVLEAFDPKEGEFHPLSDGPGIQSFPEVVSSKDGMSAFGITSPLFPGKEHIGFGRQRFSAAHVMKLNCVTHVSPAPAGRYAFNCLWAIGTRLEVERAIRDFTAK